MLKAGDGRTIREWLGDPGTTGGLYAAELPGIGLVAAVGESRDAAIAMAVLAARTPATAKILRHVAELLERSAARVQVALAAHPDVDAIRAEVRLRTNP